jgi:hypothetical protein
MKPVSLPSVLIILSLLVAVSSPVHATPSITPTDLGDLGTMPGSATDFTFFGSATQFPTIGAHYFGDGVQPTVLTDFTVGAATNSDAAYGAGPGPNSDTRYSSIYTPASSTTTVQTGIIFNGSSSTPFNLVTFTLGSTPGFNYGDFDVFVMYGNGQGDGNVRDTALSLTLNSGTSQLATITQAVTDDNTDITEASFYEFEIKGAASGETLSIGAESDALTYLGGVSFESAPEPSVYAMLFSGAALLFSVAWFRRKLTA